jgi:hypothetical protein
VPAVDFITHVRQPGTQDLRDNESDDAPPATCNMARLGGVMIQLYQALTYLHSAGKLHCDIKPSNVLVTPDGILKLVDFGLVTDTSSLLTDHTTSIRGTPAYISPEQVRGQPPTTASDWYGVGVMLFEALTGRRPFDSTVSEILEAKQVRSAPSPQLLVGGIPEPLNDLCCGLLARDPQARPPGAEVLRALERTWPAATIATRLSSDHRAEVPLVGRQEQLAVLDRAFNTLSGRPNLVLLHGASGMGKSSLVRRFLARLRRDSADVVILEGRCSERESVPYKALDTVVDQLAHYLGALPPGIAMQMIPRECAALARLFPVLRRVGVIEGNRRTPRPKDMQELRRRGTMALRELLRNVAARQPLVLTIDDLHWTDADSAALLDDVLFGEDALPLLFIGCYRTGEERSNAALRVLAENAAAAHRRGHCWLDTVIVEELSRSDAQELARTLSDQLGGATPLDAVVDESGGSPLFIHQLVQYSAAASAPDNSPSENLLPPGAGALSLDSVICARARGFGDGARRLLEVLAVFGGPLNLSVAGEVARLGDGALGDSVILRTGRLARSRIAGTQEKFEVYHDRIREAIIGDIQGDALRVLHHRLAEALERSDEADPESLLYHFREGGEPRTAAKYALVAANRAGDALAFERAARLYLVALELGHFDDGGRAVRVKAADALGASGHGYDAAQAYLQASLGAAPSQVLDLKRRASEQLLQSGHLDEGLSVVGDVLGRVGLRLSATPRRALLSLLALRARILVRGLRFTERDATNIPPEVLMRVDTSWSVTTGLAFVDHIRSAEFGARNLLLALDAGEPLRIVRSLAMELGYSSIAGARSQPRNEKLIAIAQPLAERVPNPEALGLLTLAKGSAAFMQGNWRVSRELCQQARQILREQCTRVSWQIDTAEFYTLLSALNLGDLEEISRRVPALIKEARERDALYAETLLRTRLAFVSSLAADDIEGAEGAVRLGMERWSQKGFHNQHYYEMVACAETQLYAGRAAEAWAGVSRKWRDLRRTLLLRVQPVFIESVHLRARTAIAAAMEADVSERNALIKDAERSASDIRKTGAPWGLGLAQLAAGCIATLRGAPSQAAQHVAAAEATFDREGMLLLRTIARRRLGELLRTREGDAMVEAANGWMRAQTIAKPDRIADMLAPGNFNGASV